MRFKKKEVEAVEETVKVEPTQITDDFGSEGLNRLRDAVNELLRR